MRPDPTGQVANFLATHRNFVIVDLYTLTTAGGEVLRYSGFNLPFTVPAAMFDFYSLNVGSSAVTFTMGPRFGRSKVTTKIGLHVDTLDLAIYAGPGDLVGQLSWQSAAFNGVFDLARFELGRLVCSTSTGNVVGPLVGYVVWFQGLVGDVEIGRTAITMTINSTLTMLTTQYPRRLWQHTCNHVFGDAMCQFDRHSMANTVQAGSGSTGGQIFTGFSPSPSNLYNQGTIIAMGGANDGYKRTINFMDGSTVYPTPPFIFNPAIGDYFSVLPGCDHTLTSCQNLFNNLQHYGGQPYIPQSEFAI